MTTACDHYNKVALGLRCKGNVSYTRGDSTVEILQGMSHSARRMPLAVPLALVMAGAALALATDVPALPALRCPTDATPNHCLQLSRTEFKLNGGYHVEFTYEVNKTLTLECFFEGPLDKAVTSGWLPRFTPALHVGNVTLSRCQNVHYAAMLAALNVTLTSPFNLEVTWKFWQRVDPESPAHFADLPLRHLTLRNAGVLHDLPPSLETHTLDDTNLSDDILEALPRTLTELRLLSVRNLTRVPAAVLDLPELRTLHVIIDGTVERSNASRLQHLFVEGADTALISDWAPPALEEVTLEFWLAESPNPIPACDKLVNLTLFYPIMRDLPAGWVVRCPRLKLLHIQKAINLHILSSRVLENAIQLTSLEISGSILSSLPAQLFADTPHLTHLDLSSNRLKQLPSSMLTLPLLSLDLGDNYLKTSVAAEVAAAFTELRSLSLAWNYDIGDLCAVGDSDVTEHKMTSSLASLSKLERLDLRATDISVICSDWREDMVNLTHLDLSYTRANNLTYQGMQYKRNVPAVVELPGRVYFTADDYDRATAAAALAPPSRKVTIIVTRVRHIRSSMQDDCHYYWIVKAFNGGLLPLHDLEIYDKPPLRTVRADLLLCGKEKACATVC